MVDDGRMVNRPSRNDLQRKISNGEVVVAQQTLERAILQGVFGVLRDVARLWLRRLDQGLVAIVLEDHAHRPHESQRREAEAGEYDAVIARPREETHVGGVTEYPFE